MTISPTQLTSNSALLFSGNSSVNTATLTLSANKLALVAVSVVASGVGTASLPSVSGAGRTWDLVASATVVSSAFYVAVFRSLGSGGSGALTINTNNTSGNRDVQWSVAEFDGVDTSGTNGSNAVVQSATSIAASTTPTATLAAFASSNNCTYGCCAILNSSAARTLAAGSGWTGLSATSQIFSSGTFAKAVEFKSANDTSVDFSASGSVSFAGVIGLEIKAQPANTYTQICAGSSTPAGSAAKAGRHTAAIVRSVMALAGLVRTPGKRLARTASPLGRITRALQLAAKTAASTPIATVRRQTGRRALAVSTPAARLASGLRYLVGKFAASASRGRLARAISARRLAGSHSAGLLRRAVAHRTASATTPAVRLRRTSVRVALRTSTSSAKLARAARKTVIASSAPLARLRRLIGISALGRSTATARIARAFALIAFAWVRPLARVRAPAPLRIDPNYALVAETRSYMLAAEVRIYMATADPRAYALVAEARG